ncbi:MAG: hypothetical protein R3C09_23860 [Pirellulaceae bacterium]|jgi:hypothetical protein
MYNTTLGLVVGCLALLLGSSRLAAQHLHRHGDHFDVHQNVPHGHDHAGHLIDSFGHHIDGHGRHTGAIGVYENGSTSFHPPHNLYGGYSNFPSYYSNYGYGGYSAGYGTSYGLGYSGLGYSSLGYSGLGLSVVVPQIVRPQVIVPQANASIATILGNSQVLSSPIPNNVASIDATNPGVVANKIPTTASAPGGKIVLRNPRHSGGSIHYSLNEFSYKINPGESQTIEHDRNWLLKFDNGLGKTLKVNLQPGTYEFRVSAESGWEVATKTAP